MTPTTELFICYLGTVGLRVKTPRPLIKASLWGKPLTLGRIASPGDSLGADALLPIGQRHAEGHDVLFP